jgi:hypothetical protein
VPAAIAAERIKAESFTIDGEAVVVGPAGLSRFDELRRRGVARTAILYTKPRWRDCDAISRRASCSMNTSPRMTLRRPS